MEHHAEAFAKAGLPFPLVTRLLGVNTLHLVVISGNDRFLAGEIVVSSTEGNVGRAGDIAHGGGFEPGFANNSSAVDRISSLVFSRAGLVAGFMASQLT